jgi:hypothetical protein
MECENILNEFSCSNEQMIVCNIINEYEFIGECKCNDFEIP